MSKNKAFNLNRKQIHNLAAYFASRRLPKFYFQSEDKALLKMKINSLAEFSFEKKIADRALRHKFLVGQDDEIYMFHLVTSGWANLGKNIDWGRFKDSEKASKLNRLNFLTSLGLIYFISGKDQYAKKSLWLIKDWYKRNPFRMALKNPFSGVPWNSLNTAIRVINLVWLFYFIKDAQKVTDSDKLFLIQLMYQHGKYLYLLNLQPRHESGNWQIHELAALAYLGILFPEFKESASWRKLAYKRLEEQTRLQFFKDGVHGEGSLSYHVVVAQLYLDAIRIARINRIKVSRKLVNFTKKMAEFAIASLKPNRTLPLVNDSHIVDLNTFILCAQQMFPQNNWDRMPVPTTKGFLLRYQRKVRKSSSLKARQFTPAMINSRLFSEAGFAIMRNRANTQYLFFDANSSWLPHTHAGKLSFDLYAHGKSLAVDPGNCSYDHFDHGDWYKRTVAHNTIQVDGRDQVLLKDTLQWDLDFNLQQIKPVDNLKSFFKKHKFPKVEIKRWLSNDIFDFISARHEAYLNLTNPLIHSRNILYIKNKYWIIIDELKNIRENLSFASHYEFLLHFLPGKMKRDSQNKVVTVKEKNVGLAAVPLKKDDIDQVAVSKAKIIYER